MILRNKKTGEVVVCGEGIIEFKAFGCKNLAEFLEAGWEDYKPAEPLIKDEKIRKAVRAWAEANNLNNVAFEDYDDENCYFIDGDYEPQIWFSKKSILESPLDDGKIYTIAELCGEEEE